MNKPLDRPEPEIIPPGVPLPRRGGDVWMDTGTRVYTTRIGPVGAKLLTLGIGAVAGVGLLFLLGTALIGLLAVGVLAVGGMIAGILRGPPRSLR